jgi:HPt (histidine-containing phosphotransfer) domain-containing protein
MSEHGSRPAQTVVPTTPGNVLDVGALAALRALDPTGAGKLLERVLAAFQSSTGRLVPRLHAACLNGDASAVREVAHTLKSSSASIGALGLSRLCANVETMIRNGFTGPLEPHVAALDAEIAVVLKALEKLLRTDQEAKPDDGA